MAQPKANDLPIISIPEADRVVNGGIYDKLFSAGAVIASFQDRIYHRQVYGHPTFPPPFNKIGFDAVFDLASLTKPLATGLAAMYLCSQNRLDIASPVGSILKDFKAPQWRNIKVEHLLDHTSGLTAWKPFYEEVVKMEAGTPSKPGRPGLKPQKLAGTLKGKEIIRGLLATETPEKPTGTVAIYSDLNFMILGFIVEEISGMPLNVFCEREMYQKLGIEDLFFVDLTAPKDKMAKVRRFVATENCAWRGKLLQGEVHDQNAWAMGGVAGHAGLFGTVDAVYQLASILLQCYNSKHPFMHSGTLRRFWTKSQRVRDTTYALSWDTPSPMNSQAGKCISLQSVGHLAFTGCSLWIDYTKNIINVFLCNVPHPTPEGKKEKHHKLRPRLHEVLFKSAEELVHSSNDNAVRGAAAFGGAVQSGSSAFNNSRGGAAAFGRGSGAGPTGTAAFGGSHTGSSAFGGSRTGSSAFGGSGTGSSAFGGSNTGSRSFGK